MTATAEPEAQVRNRVIELIEERVEAITSRNGDVVLADEAADLLADLRETELDALLNWRAGRDLADLRQQLQVRLALVRRNGRVGAFDGYEGHDVSPFDGRYALKDNTWRRKADMKRADWRDLIEIRQGQATESLYDIALARRMIEKLPNENAKTGDVLSVDELLKMQEAARKSAKRSVDRFSKSKD